ncbi:hypothetical protein BGP_1800 [Beggiatoa sp. PS]|nr:hypothetical protein BGP_1800 [Beggiatoa sp. PS]
MFSGSNAPALEPYLLFLTFDHKYAHKVPKEKTHDLDWLRHL